MPWYLHTYLQKMPSKNKPEGGKGRSYAEDFAERDPGKNGLVEEVAGEWEGQDRNHDCCGRRVTTMWKALACIPTTNVQEVLTERSR